MRIFFIFKPVLNNLSKICLLLILLLAGTQLINAQCPDSNCAGTVFPKGEIVYVDIDFRFRNTPIYSQITAGLDAWNYDNEFNGSEVLFSYNGVPTSGTYTVMHITSEALTNPYGSPDTTTIAQVSYNGVNELGDIIDATIVFNTNAMASEDIYSPNYNQPYYDPYAPGYDTVFKKKTMHEVGHTLGLCDVSFLYQVNGASVMNRSTEDCVNDSCNTQPLGIQSCNGDAVSRVARYSTPPAFPTPTPTPLSYCEQFPLDCTGGADPGGGGGRGGRYQCYDVYEEDVSYVCVDGHGCSETVFYEYLYSYCSF